jgi:signal transduction histidine kinase
VSLLHWVAAVWAASLLLAGLAQRCMLKRGHALQLAQARASARRLLTVRAELVARCVHDVRSPLTGSLGLNAFVLEREDVSREAKQELLIAQEAIEQALALLEDLSDLASASSAQLEFNEEPFDLRRVIHSTLGATRPQLREAGLATRTEFRPGTPERLKGDPRRIQQVLTNLLTNAIRHSPPHGLISLVVEGSRLAERGTIRLDVEDHGPGVPVSERERVFETYVHDGFGQGLGLAISRAIVESMGGEIGMDEGVGGGARAWFSLNLAIDQS